MIPGLKSIDVEDADPLSGKTRVVFNIEDDKAEEFFKFLMLENNDTAGFEKLLTNALETYLNRNKT